MKRWFRAISIERRNGFHTKAVRRGLRLGFALFIVSEVMLFFAFFWTYFHVSIIVSPELGSWPPVGVEIINPLNLPLANTLLLLFSGWTLHCAHLNVLAKKPPCFWFHLTMGLGWLFILTQAYEYVMAGFTLSTTVYGSIFFFLTGLHGMHVLIGLVFLIFALRSVRRNSQDNTLLDLAAWYWHFVDIVWLVLFISVYWQPILC
jgi:cytochrome c oxidase subunit 3